MGECFNLKQRGLNQAVSFGILLLRISLINLSLSEVIRSGSLITKRCHFNKDTLRFNMKNN